MYKLTGTTKEELIEQFKVFCDRVKEDADEIIGEIEDVQRITVTFEIVPFEVLKYKVEREKLLRFID